MIERELSVEEIYRLVPAYPTRGATVLVPGRSPTNQTSLKPMRPSRIPARRTARQFDLGALDGRGRVEKVDRRR